MELDPSLSVSLLDSSSRVGGVVQTLRRDGYLIECASDMFITRDPWAVDLCRRIGFEDQLIETNEGQRRAFVVRGDRLYPVPDGFTLMTPVRVWPVATTPLLSLPGKFRLACEYFVPPRREQDDESLASFATRRMGRETYERLIQPLISSIYTADPDKLSMRAAMPQFFAMEQKYGSLARGMRQFAKARRANAAGTGARYGLFVTARDGLSTFIQAIAGRLPAGCVRLNSSVQQLVSLSDGGWEVSIEGAAEPETFDAVILATPAVQTAGLLSEIDEQLTAELREITHAGASIVALGYRRDQISHAMDGFGFVVPLIENRRILSVSFSSVKFDGRAPKDRVLLRVFVGGACQPELADLPDDELKRLVQDELRVLMGAEGEPELFEVFRWPATMPQYHVGHLQRTARIEQQVATHPRLELAGNAYRGVGIPYCVHSGEQAAERLLGVEGKDAHQHTRANTTST
jgi:oxygen-dependent protoporphyrinogen oxidase